MKNKSIKKVFAIILAIAMIFSTVMVAFAADDKEITPVIVVGGYSSSDLFLDFGTENEKQVWSLNFKEIFSKAAKDLKSKFGITLEKAVKGDKNAIAESLYETLFDVLDEMVCNDDGTSKHNVTAGLSDPAISNTKALNEKYGEGNKFVQLPKINNYFCDEVGDENVFNCHVDFRMGALKCAKDLDKYVKAIKDYTGAKKVSIFGLSHGGMTVGVYLNLIANYPEMVSTSFDDLDKIVMFHPALAGAAFLDDFMERNLKIDLRQIVEYVEVGMLTESQFETIVHLSELGILDPILNRVVDRIFNSVVGNWGSVWDFACPEKYETWKAKYLDSEKNARIIEESDFMHYNIMPYYAEAFAKARENDVDVNIIAGYGRSVVTGNKLNTDGILATASTTGAKTAPFGSRFANGYKATGSVCTDRTHNHISPNLTVDASYNYLPENTFYIYKQFHGQAWFDPYTMNLCLKLMFTDEIKDIYSSKDYTQFEFSRTSKDEVLVKFDGNAETGRVARDSKGVFVTNLSKKYPIKINSIYFKKTNLNFNIISTGIIKPGKTVYVEFDGALPSKNMTFDELTVGYTRIGAASAIGIRTMPFSFVSNEENDDYDENSSFVNIGANTNYLSITVLFNHFVKIVKIFFENIKNLFH